MDIQNGPHHDLSRKVVQDTIYGWLSSKCVLCVWIATPCSSFSRARHGPPGTSWCALRDANNLYGFPGLATSARQAVTLGNVLMKFSAQILRRCAAMHIPAFLENPATSFLWIMPPILAVSSTSTAISSAYDACQYGAPWRKRTGILSVNSFSDPSVSKRCMGRRGMCSRTGCQHVVLTGRDPQSKLLWTKIAEPYPKTMCAVYAQHITKTIVRRCQSFLFQLV